MTRRAVAALLLALALGFALGRATVTATPRPGSDTLATTEGRSLRVERATPGPTGAPRSSEAVGADVAGGAPTDPTTPPVDHAGTPVVVPADAPEAKATVPAGLVGLASWYRYLPGQAAAGPRLRALLGPGWRGMVVTVVKGGRKEGEAA